MKRTLYVVGIVLALLVLMNVMTSCVKNSEKYADAVEIQFTETDNISFDKTSGRAKFDDGIISYSWDTSKWHFSLYNGTPQLEMPWNKFELKFTILSNDKGVANDFWNYAKQGLMDYYGESSKYVWSHMFASATDSYFNNKGYFGEQTGFYDVHGNKDSDTVKFNLAIVHVVTDGNNSAVICVSVNGFKDDITNLHDIIFAEHEFNPVLEDVSSDIFNSFSFYDDGTEVAPDKEDKTTHFSYRDAYNKFKEVYSWGSHAEYIEYVDNEADKLKNEVFRTNNEIMEILKEKYEYISDARCKMKLK